MAYNPQLISLDAQDLTTYFQNPANPTLTIQETITNEAVSECVEPITSFIASQEVIIAEETFYAPSVMVTVPEEEGGTVVIIFMYPALTVANIPTIGTVVEVVCALSLYLLNLRLRHGIFPRSMAVLNSTTSSHLKLLTSI
jgi:hypothetical protein